MEQVNSIASIQTLISRFDRMTDKYLAEFLINEELKNSQEKNDHDSK